MFPSLLSELWTLYQKLSFCWMFSNTALDLWANIVQTSKDSPVWSTCRHSEVRVLVGDFGGYMLVTVETHVPFRPEVQLPPPAAQWCVDRRSQEHETYEKS